MDKKYSGFTQVPNIIFSFSLSHGAFKLCCYMYSCPKDWQYYNKAICKELGISDRALAAYWKELIDKKIISRERKVVNNFVNGGYIYELLIGAKNNVHDERNNCGTDYCEEKPTKKDKTGIDYNDIMEVWNLFANDMNLSTIILINDDRKKLVNKLFKTYGDKTRDAIHDAMMSASESKFLLGKTSADFKITFDWFFKVNNITKILEGNYNK